MERPTFFRLADLAFGDPDGLGPAGHLTISVPVRPGPELVRLVVTWGDGTVTQLDTGLAAGTVVAHRYAGADGVLDDFGGTLAAHYADGTVAAGRFRAVFNPLGPAVAVPDQPTPGWPIGWLSGGQDTVFGSIRGDLMLGGAGNDLLAGVQGPDTLLGGAGDDTLEGDWNFKRWTGGDLVDGGPGNDLLRTGGDHDTLIGGEGNDTFRGGEGNDLLQGGAGDDRMLAGAGANTVYGEAGADSLRGGHLADLLDGGEGDDTLVGGDRRDTLTGGAGDDRLKAGFGDDLLQGGEGADGLIGGDGADTLQGGEGADTLAGGWDADLLEGGAGEDLLQGGPGADTLRGGQGADLLRSSADGDADVFVWAAGDGADRVIGFEPDIDRIVLEGLGPLDPARFVGGPDPLPPAGPGAWVLYDTTSGLLSVDWDGPGGEAPEAVARLVGAPLLSAADLA